MLYFLNLNGYEMDLFGLARLVFYKPVFLHCPHPSVFGVDIGDEEHISCFNMFERRG